jgi:hypothetical protein
MLKEPFEVWKRYFVRQTSSLPSPVLNALLLGDSAGRMARELWCTNLELPLSISTMLLCADISPGGWTIGSLVVVVQRRSLTSSAWWWGSIFIVDATYVFSLILTLNFPCILWPYETGSVCSVFLMFYEYCSFVRKDSLTNIKTRGLDVLCALYSRVACVVLLRGSKTCQLLKVTL